MVSRGRISAGGIREGAAPIDIDGSYRRHVRRGSQSGLPIVQLRTPHDQIGNRRRRRSSPSAAHGRETRSRSRGRRRGRILLSHRQGAEAVGARRLREGEARARHGRELPHSPLVGGEGGAFGQGGDASIAPGRLDTYRRSLEQREEAQGRRRRRLGGRMRSQSRSRRHAHRHDHGGRVSLFGMQHESQRAGVERRRSRGAAGAEADGAPGGPRYALRDVVASRNTRGGMRRYELSILCADYDVSDPGRRE
mmetsp:Transcript_17383/g.32575  ORF Transcript_17383/g.32575 Transcript_17383/m.32575 type:complete len:251 (-) Transcript_17383:164-916(-)